MPWKPRKSRISKMQVVLIQVNSDFRVALPLMQRLTSDVALLHDDSYKSIAHDQWHGMGWQLLEMTWSLSHQNVSWHQTAANWVCNHAFDWLCACILLLKLFYGYLYIYILVFILFFPIFCLVSLWMGYLWLAPSEMNSVAQHPVDALRGLTSLRPIKFVKSFIFHDACKTDMHAECVRCVHI